MKASRLASSLRSMGGVTTAIGVTLTLCLFSSTACDGQAGTPPSLLVISLDTTRADHLPVYGYPRDTAPALQRLSRTSVVFEHAFTHETNTTPAHASMFTGLYPQRHGATRNGVPIRDDVETLASVLADSGFTTGAIVSATPLKAEASGLDRGFSSYDEAFDRRRRGAIDTSQRAVEWLRSQRDARFFLFVHFYDAHGAYRPPPPYDGLYASQAASRHVATIPGYQRVSPSSTGWTLGPFIDRYDSMIRFVDDRLAELLAEVDLDRTIVVVLSDHGESLDERHHVLDHGGQLFDEQIRIPLVVHVPGLAPGRVTAIARAIDLFPTLLGLLGIEPPDDLNVDGRDLYGAMHGERPGTPVPVFATARAVTRRHADRSYVLDPKRRIDSIRLDGWKLIRYPGRSKDMIELYDLEHDPGERVNVADREPARRVDLLERLDRWSRSGNPAQPPPTLSPQIERELEALGYAE